MHEAPPILNGLVLTGGLSSRMGSDKALINYHGKPQREFVFEALRSVCHEVFTSCRHEHNVPLWLNPLPDIMDIRSPLNGILTAFHTNPERAWLVVAVDLPNVSPIVLQELVSHRDTRKLATCFFDSSAGAPEPLLTIWEPASQPLLEARAASGNISPRSFLQEHDVHFVYGMNESVFFNVNDPAMRTRWHQEINR
ncbi:MAG TPA: NTP transferase domain-containing protein [Chryseolinea sp.]|nr:NTP transferase domain-containing protein [Chryseolinea sp.]